MTTKYQEALPTIETVITYYYLDVSRPDEKAAHEELTVRLKAEGLHCFNVYHEGRITPAKQESVTLETKCLFDSQWNTTDGKRVFDWYEGIVPNKDIKAGHYLRQTDEMAAIRSQVHKCGYCGGYSDGPGFHYACLGSPYLKPENLPLLRLRPIKSASGQVPPLTDAERAELLEHYEAAQAERLRKKAIKMKSDKLAELDKNVKDAHTELEAFTMLLNAGIDTENCIFYSHKQTFCFGWSRGLTREEAAAIDRKIKSLPFKWAVEYKGA